MRAEPQLAPPMEFDCHSDWVDYVRRERVKRDERHYRNDLLKIGGALACGAALIVYAFIKLNTHGL